MNCSKYESGAPTATSQAMVAGDASDMDSTSFDPKRVIAVVGPTSAGKTRLAMTLANRFPVEMVCMDSMQIYAELKVGTARPDPPKPRISRRVNATSPILFKSPMTLTLTFGL